MSDHALMMSFFVVGFTVQVLGLIVLGLMLRESQRLTRAVAGLVYQETLTARPRIATFHTRGSSRRFGADVIPDLS